MATPGKVRFPQGVKQPSGQSPTQIDDRDYPETVLPEALQTAFQFLIDAGGRMRSLMNANGLVPISSLAEVTITEDRTTAAPGAGSNFTITTTLGRKRTYTGVGSTFTAGPPVANRNPHLVVNSTGGSAVRGWAPFDLVLASQVRNLRIQPGSFRVNIELDFTTIAYWGCPSEGIVTYGGQTLESDVFNLNALDAWGELVTDDEEVTQ